MSVNFISRNAGSGTTIANCPITEDVNIRGTLFTIQDTVYGFQIFTDYISRKTFIRLLKTDEIQSTVWKQIT